MNSGMNFGLQRENKMLIFIGYMCAANILLSAF